MEYIKETRGGYDEWGDSYNAIVGLSFENRRNIDTRFIEDVFVDQEGNMLEVELPARDRIGNEIKVEKYSDGYEIASAVIREFKEYVTEVGDNRIVVDFDTMIEENEWEID